jgi:hypothetical protein
MMVKKLQTHRGELLQTLRHVLHPICDVVQTTSSPGEELGDLGIVTNCAEKLHTGFTDFKHDGLDPIRINALTMARATAEELRVSLYRGFEVDYGDPDVVDLQDTHAGQYKNRAI